MDRATTAVVCIVNQTIHPNFCNEKNVRGALWYLEIWVSHDSTYEHDISEIILETYSRVFVQKVPMQPWSNQGEKYIVELLERIGYSNYKDPTGPACLGGKRSTGSEGFYSRAPGFKLRLET